VIDPKDGLTHLDESGSARMVDISNKQITARVAEAEAFVSMSASVVRLLREGAVEKGDAFGVARVAGIMAAKKTHELIPLCHPLGISEVKVDLEFADGGVKVSTQVKTTGRTGVEMEALTAAAVAALTLYDMCKSADKSIIIERVGLVAKSGGRSGDWRREE